MRHQLTNDLGVRWRRTLKSSLGDRGHHQPSGRRILQAPNEQIDDALRELEEEIVEARILARSSIVLLTRSAKNHTPADDS